MDQSETVLVDLTNVPSSEMHKYDSHITSWPEYLPVDLPYISDRDAGHVRYLRLSDIGHTCVQFWCACGRSALFIGEVDFVFSGKQTRHTCAMCAREFLPKNLRRVARYSLSRDRGIVKTLIHLGGQVVNNP